MATFRLPDLGEGLAEAEILAWHIKPGDTVKADQPMVSVETAKAVVEVPVPFDGTVRALLGAIGDILATGAPLVEFDSGTVVGTMPPTRSAPLPRGGAVGGAGAGAGAGGGGGGGAGGAASGRGDGARAAAAEARAMRPSPSTAVHPRALPLARGVARHLGLDLDRIAGSGPEGAVVLADVLGARGTAPSPSLALASLPAGARVEPLRGARRAMAHNMTLARDAIPMSTVCDDADIHDWPARSDFTLRLLRAVRSAAQAEPALNAWYDAARQTRILLAHIDVALAVDTPAGLIVPVVRHVESRSPEELRAEIARQKQAAHARSALPADLRGFTFMLSNFGTLAGRYGTPLVVPPAVALLGAGRVREEAVAIAGSIVARRRMPLSLSFDHRCVTGGEACRFLAAVIADLGHAD
jgi:pyruvate dehydrogenase E2 component (dihydrolipoamide acetyltransferase)